MYSSDLCVVMYVLIPSWVILWTLIPTSEADLVISSKDKDCRIFISFARSFLSLLNNLENISIFIESGSKYDA